MNGKVVSAPPTSPPNTKIIENGTGQGNETGNPRGKVFFPPYILAVPHLHSIMLPKRGSLVIFLHTLYATLWEIFYFLSTLNIWSGLWRLEPACLLNSFLKPTFAYGCLGSRDVLKIKDSQVIFMLTGWLFICCFIVLILSRITV